MTNSKHEFLKKVNLIKDLMERQKQLIDNDDYCNNELNAINTIIKGLISDISEISHCNECFINET